MRNLPILIFAVFALASCTVAKPGAYQKCKWVDVAVIEGLEVFVDTSSIRHENGLCYVLVKTVYSTEDSKLNYTEKIKRASTQKGKSLKKKMIKWDDFSYNISLRAYDCSNKRSKIIAVTDFSIDGEAIVSTVTPESKSQWADIGKDSMGDYLIYYVCDYGN